MARKTIPDDVKAEVQAIIDRFNQDVVKQPNRYFVMRIRGRYVYLDRKDGGIVSQVGRLTHTGDMDDWEFTIFKWSTERYDPDEWFFPGSQHIDGTIEGALRACMEAYP